MNASVAVQLSTFLSDDTVYNIGMSEHDLLVCAQNLPAAVHKYAPSKYVVLETMSIQFSNDDLSKTLSGELPELLSYNGGVIGLLQQNQFLRRMYHQLNDFMKQQESQNDISLANDVSDEDANDAGLLSALLEQMADTVASSGAKLIVAYHPSITLNKDGTISFSTTAANEDAFGALCEENGVLFLNMRDRFQTEYDENHVLPYGFANSAVGVGHLNKYGHRMMAEELYALMKEEGL